MKMTKAFFKKNFPNAEIIFRKNYHFVSGFIILNGKVIYFCSNDDRDSRNDLGYIRTATDINDYYGGKNLKVTKENIIDMISKMFMNYNSEIYK